MVALASATMLGAEDQLKQFTDNGKDVQAELTNIWTKVSKGATVAYKLKIKQEVQG
jgi:hypothetical protein